MVRRFRPDDLRLRASSSSLLTAAPGSGSGSAERNSATTSRFTRILNRRPASLRTLRTSSGSRRRASLMEISVDVFDMSLRYFVHDGTKNVNSAQPGIEDLIPQDFSQAEPAPRVST